MNAKQVDGLNIGLIILSAILAFNFPLTIFILSFAILGPLHYLTEINWLDKKNYFTPLKNRMWLWIGLIATAAMFFPKFYGYLYPEQYADPYNLVSRFNNWTNGFLFLTLLLAIGFTFFKNYLGWIAAGIAGVLGALALNSNEDYSTWVGIFIPTVIHVYFFTLFFMFFGAKKSKSKLGYAAVALAIFIPLMFTTINIESTVFEFKDSMKSIYTENNFHVPPVLFGKTIGASDGTSFLFGRPVDTRLMMFFSFIYLYHYLNWFSKTSLIQWHKNLTVKTSSVIAVMWVGMLLLFYFNFRLGLIVGLFFSFLHVILEFPLNVVSIKGIFTKSATTES